MGCSLTQTRGVTHIKDFWATTYGKALKLLPAPILVDFLIYELTLTQVQDIVRQKTDRSCKHLPVVRQVKICMGLFDTAFELLTHPLIPPEALNSFINIDFEVDRQWLIARLLWETAGEQTPDLQYNQECEEFARKFSIGLI